LEKRQRKRKEKKERKQQATAEEEAESNASAKKAHKGKRHTGESEPTDGELDLMLLDVETEMHKRNSKNFVGFSISFRFVFVELLAESLLLRHPCRSEFTSLCVGIV
jgi:hypothetical protein